MKSIHIDLDFAYVQKNNYIRLDEVICGCILRLRQRPASLFKIIPVSIGCIWGTMK